MKKTPNKKLKFPKGIKDISNLKDYLQTPQDKNGKRLGEGSFGVVFREVFPMDAKRLLMLNGLNPNTLKEIKSEEKNQDIENRQNSKEIDEVGSNKKNLSTQLGGNIIEKKLKHENEFHLEKKSSELLSKIPRHPNIASYIGYNRFQNSILFSDCGITMGEQLGKELAKHGQKMDQLLFSNLMEQFAKGLNHLHENDLIHNDIKPDNLAVKPNTGIASLIDVGLLSTTKTRYCVQGTPHFMAPEKLSARKAERNGKYKTPFNGEEQKKQDIYSLGISIIEMLPALPHRFLVDISKSNAVDRHNKIHQMLENNEANKHRLPDVTWGTGPLLLRMINSNPDVRPTAKEVADCFGGLCKQIKDHRENIRQEAKRRDNT